LFDVSSDSYGIDALKPQPPVFTLLKELLNRSGVCSARIPVANVGGKEFDETVLRALILGTDAGGQHLDADANQRRWRRNFFGQKYGRLPHSPLL
jgi:hypothetical protein